MMTYYARMIYTPLEIGMLFAVAVLGLAFAVCVISYTIRVKRCGGVADGIAAIAGEERLAEIKIKAGAKAHVRALLVLAVAMLFNIDIAVQSGTFAGFSGFKDQHIKHIAVNADGTASAGISNGHPNLDRTARDQFGNDFAGGIFQRSQLLRHDETHLKLLAVD